MAEGAARIAAARSRWTEAARRVAIAPEVVATFLATRVLLSIVALLALDVLPRDTVNGFPYDASATPLLNAWSRWDGYWYLRIASDGYDYVPGVESGVAFWPLYPMLLALGGALTGLDDTGGLALIGILISNAALLVAIPLLVLLVRLDFDDGVATRAASYLLAFPTSFFLSAVYPESLFLALALGSFYCARTERWWLSGALGGAAALTRPHGVLLVIPLLAEYLTQRGISRRAVRAEAVALGLVPTGLLAYFLYLWVRFGNPLAGLDSQARGWGRALTVPWESFVDFFSGPLHAHGGGNHSLLDLAGTVAFLALAVASWRMLRPSYAVFLSVFLLGALSSGTLSSLIRVEATMFPAFIVLGVLAATRPWFDRAYLVISVGLGAILMAMFAQWYWVG